MPPPAHRPFPLGPLNVKSFGAVGNGTTDDTDAIQAAFDALSGGGASAEVQFPGVVNYKTTAPIVVRFPCTLTGAGTLSQSISGVPALIVSSASVVVQINVVGDQVYRVAAGSGDVLVYTGDDGSRELLTGDLAATFKRSTRAMLLPGALGVGNIEVAATLGAVVGRVEIFNAIGQSRGFLPVYQSIGPIAEMLTAGWKFDETDTGGASAFVAYDYLGQEHLAPRGPMARVATDLDAGAQQGGMTAAVNTGWFHRQQDAVLAIGDFDWYWIWRGKFSDVAADQYLISHREASGIGGFDVHLQGSSHKIIFNIQGATSVTSSVVHTVDGLYHTVEVWWDHAAQRANVCIDGPGGTLTTAGAGPSAPPAPTELNFHCGAFNDSGTSPFTGIVDFMGFLRGRLPSSDDRDDLTSGTYGPLSGVPSATNFGYNLAGGLAHWYDWLATPSLTDVTDVLFVGDSITQGFEATDIETDGFVSQIRDKLYTAYPLHGGRGFFPSAVIIEADFYANTKWVVSGTAVNLIGQSMGFNGSQLRAIGAGASVFVGAQTGDRFEIHWVEKSDSVPFTVLIDGVSAGTLGTSNPTPVYRRQTLMASAAGTYDLTFVPTTAGNIYVVGVNSQTGAKGLRVHECAKAGALVGDVCGSDDLLTWMDGMNPKLVVLAMSVNDLVAQTPLADYETDVRRLVNKALGMGADVCILVNHARVEPGIAALQQWDYNAVLLSVADDLNCAMVWMYDRWGPLPIAAETLALTAGITGSGTGGDVHPSDLGHTDYYTELVHCLTPALTP